MRSARSPLGRLAVIVGLVASVALLSALAAPALDARTRAADAHSAVGRHPSTHDAAHPGSPGARTANRVHPGAAVLPFLALALTLATLATPEVARRRRIDATAWHLEWSRGPPAVGFAVLFA